MRIAFPTILFWFFPRLKALPPSELEALLDEATRRSVQRVRRYGGWCWLLSLVLPFLVLYTLLLMSGAFDHGMYIAGIPVLIFLSVLSASSLHSLFQALLLRPAIRDLLREKGNCDQST